MSGLPEIDDGAHPFMNSDGLAPWFSTLITGALIAALGGGLAGVLGSLCVDWYRVPSREGGAGFFVLFTIILGAFLGLIVGVIGSRLSVVGADAHFLLGLGRSAAAAVGLALVSTLVAWWAADIPPKRDGRHFVVELELKHPLASPILGTDGLAPHATLMVGAGRRSGGYGELKPATQPTDPGHGVVQGVFELQTRSAAKSLVISDGPDSSLHFPMPLGGRPKKRDETWSEWIAPEWLYRKGQFHRPGMNDTYACRYRVRLEEPVVEVKRPSEPTAEEQAEARFTALKAEASLSEWIPYTAFGTPARRLERALEAIRARPALLTEVRDLALSDQPRDTEAALHLLAQLKNPTAEFAAVVAETGRDIARRLERGVAITPEQDGHYEWAADISVRFHGWIEAARLLRAQGVGDYANELRSILKLGRQRPDSIALRSDVVRVASFYLHEWTGEAPDPSDPKPR